MNSQEYDKVETTDWNCFACNSKNCSSFLYHAYNLNVSNSFDPLAGIPGDDSVFLHSVCSPRSVFEPKTHSSPNPSQDLSKTRSSSSASNRSGSSTNRMARPLGDNIRVAVLNANSIKGKRCEVATFCHNVDPDIMIVSETKLDSSVYSAEFLPSHYSAHRLDRNIHGGGVMVAVKNNLIVEDVRLEQVDCEFITVRISIQNASPLYVAAYYRPPDESVDRLDKLEAALDQLLTRTNKNSKVTLLIGGDFNVGDVDWESGMVKADSKKKSLCERALNIVNNA